MWTPDGAVMIDPAAHGGHPEADLAMLALFGCPFFGDVVAGYQEVKTLAAGWQDRLGLHQLFPLLAHVVLFGQTYAGRAEAAARSAHRLLAVPQGVRARPCSMPETLMMQTHIKLPRAKVSTN